MAKCIFKVTVELPVVVDGVFVTVIGNFLSDLFPHHVFVRLKAK